MYQQDEDQQFKTFPREGERIILWITEPTNHSMSCL